MAQSVGGGEGGVHASLSPPPPPQRCRVVKRTPAPNCRHFPQCPSWAMLWASPPAVMRFVSLRKRQPPPPLSSTSWQPGVSNRR